MILSLSTFKNNFNFARASSPSICKKWLRQNWSSTKLGHVGNNFLFGSTLNYYNEVVVPTKKIKKKLSWLDEPRFYLLSLIYIMMIVNWLNIVHAKILQLPTN